MSMYRKFVEKVEGQIEKQRQLDKIKNIKEVKKLNINQIEEAAKRLKSRAVTDKEKLEAQLLEDLIIIVKDIKKDLQISRYPMDIEHKIFPQAKKKEE